MEEEIERTESPLPIQVERPMRRSPTQQEQDSTSLLLQSLENLQESGLRERMWMPMNHTILMEEEWNQLIRYRIQEEFQENLTPLE